MEPLRLFTHVTRRVTRFCGAGHVHGGHARALERPWTLQKLLPSAVDALSHAIDPQCERCRLESPPCPPSVSAAPRVPGASPRKRQFSSHARFFPRSTSRIRLGYPLLRFIIGFCRAGFRRYGWLQEHDLRRASEELARVLWDRFSHPGGRALGECSALPIRWMGLGLTAGSGGSSSRARATSSARGASADLSRS